MSKLLVTIINKACGEKIKKVEKKNVITFFVIKDILKFIKNKTR